MLLPQRPSFIERTRSVGLSQPSLTTRSAHAACSGPSSSPALGAMRDAHDVAGGAAVQEEALDRAREVRSSCELAVDVDELVPAAEQHRLVERPARGEPDEARDARIRDRERLGARLVGGRIDARGPNLSRPLCIVLVVICSTLASCASLISRLIRAISRSQMCRSSCSIDEDVVERPVKVVRDVRYLLVDLLQGVARYPPAPAAPPSPPSRSTSNSVWHEGHLAWTFGAPSSLIRR